MLLIVEIILTVVAWRKGWRGWALLPIVGAMLISFFIGFAVEMSGGYVEVAAPSFFIFDIAAIVSLSILIKKARKRTNAPSNGMARYRGDDGIVTSSPPLKKIDGEGIVMLR